MRIRTTLSALFWGFGDRLGLRRERAFYRILSVVGWLLPAWLLAEICLALYLVMTSWVDLFTGQWETLNISGGFFILQLLMMGFYCAYYIGLYAPITSITRPGAPYPSTTRGMALALLEAARARDTTLTLVVAPGVAETPAQEEIRACLKTRSGQADGA